MQYITISTNKEDFLKMASVSILNEINIKKVCLACLKVETEAMFSIFDEIELVENENQKTYIYNVLTDIPTIKVYSNHDY